MAEANKLEIYRLLYRLNCGFVFVVVESEDSARFERIRAAREKQLRDPDDVFLKAEERRQELKKQKQGKKERGH